MSMRREGGISRGVSRTGGGHRKQMEKEETRIMLHNGYDKKKQPVRTSRVTNLSRKTWGNAKSCEFVVAQMKSLQ